MLNGVRDSLSMAAVSGANADANSVPPANAGDARPASRPVHGRRSVVLSATAAGCTALFGGSVAYAGGGHLLAVLGAAAAWLIIVAAAIILTAVLGDRDPRSPFERLMLLACVALGRSPATYLPARGRIVAHAPPLASVAGSAMPGALPGAEATSNSALRDVEAG